MKKVVLILTGMLVAGNVWSAEWTYDATANTVTDGNWVFKNARPASELASKGIFIKEVEAGSGDLDFGSGIVKVKDSSTTYEITEVEGYYQQSHFTNYWPSGCVRFPTTMTALGAYVFDQCPDITEVIFDTPNLTRMCDDGTIYGRQFYKCTSLTNVVLNAPKLKAIPYAAFSQCTNLQSVTLNTPLLTTYARACFNNCKSLTNDVSTIIMPWAKTIEVNAFSMCSLSGDLVLTNLQSIGVQAFYNCKRITSVDITADDTRTTTSALLGAQAFLSMESCTSVVVRSETVTDLSSTELFKESRKLRRIVLDFPALQSLNKNDAESKDMFLDTSRTFPNYLELTLTASNLVYIGTHLNLNCLEHAIFYGNCPGASMMTNFFKGNLFESYAVTLSAPKQGQFGWRRLATPLTDEEKARADKPEGAYGTWTTGGGEKVWMVHVDSPYFTASGTLVIIR